MTVSNPVLAEAMLLAADAYLPTAAHPPVFGPDAITRGWSPLIDPLAGIEGFDGHGVQTVRFAAPGLNEAGEITSVAHFYTGTLEGREVTAIAFRGTDEEGELQFQGNEFAPDVYGWDLFVQAHAPAVLAAVADAMANGREILVTGQSLGGILAEHATALLISGSPAEAVTTVYTFGSPGSVRDVTGDQINLTHTDDIVVAFGDTQPLLQREGNDVAIERPEIPEGGLPPFSTPEEFLALFADPANGVEHSIPSYIDSALAISAATRVIPGFSEAFGDLGRYGEMPFDRIVFGEPLGDLIQGSEFDELLIGRDGKDIIRGGAGDDGLFGNGQNDNLHGGNGDDRADGGSGHDRIFGNNGDDRLFGQGGNDLIDGGDGNDRLFGHNGNDRLFGGAGDDFIKGGNGDDFIDGGDGFDILFIDDETSNIALALANTGELYVFSKKGLDTVSNIEAIETKDGFFDLDGIVTSATSQSLDDLIASNGAV